MKVYLHDERRNKYYAGSSNWVTDAKQGLDFQSIEAAMHAKDQQDLSCADLVVIGEDPTRMVRLTASGLQSFPGV